MRTVTRRFVLRLLGAIGITTVFGEFAHGENAMAQIDHLLLGTPDLERGMDWVEKRTGVKAVVGGSHPGVGTRNALLSLGGNRYLELIAPDPAQTAFNFNIDLRKLTEPRLVTWAASTTDIEATAKVAQQAGYRIFGPHDGSRKKPDGSVLKWKSLGVLAEFAQNGVDPFPFFIQWDVDSLHPAQDSPKGCELESFEIGHPKASDLTRALQKLNVSVKVNQAENAGLVAVLQTPNGRVELT